MTTNLIVSEHDKKIEKCHVEKSSSFKECNIVLFITNISIWQCSCFIDHQFEYGKWKVIVNFYNKSKSPIVEYFDVYKDKVRKK